VRADDDALPSVLCPVTESVEAVVVANVDVPVTARVPFEVRELVKIPSVERRSAVKKDPVDVALVKDAERAVRRDVKKLEDVALVLARLAMVPLVEARLVAVIPVAEAVVSVVCPDTVSVDAVVVASVDVPVTASVPFETREEVAVMVPPVIDDPVSVEIPADTALRSVVKRLDEVELVKVAEVTARLFAIRFAILVVESVVTPVKVLSPAKD
jgi:hypothetical protein